MFEKIELSRMAQAVARHAGARVGVIADNIANADTPGFRARDLPTFQSELRGGLPMQFSHGRHISVQPLGMAEATFQHATESAPNGNTVSLEAEMAQSVHARQQHEIALAVYRSTSSVLKLALGRGGR